MAKSLWRIVLDWLRPRPQPRPGPIPGSRPVGWSSMAALLEDLETLADEHDEVFDTAVRERMWTVVEAVLITQRTGVDVPDDLGMFTAEGNRRLASTLRSHLQRLRDVFAALGLDSAQKRLHSFFNPDLRTERGHRVDDFFGHP